MQQNPSHKDPLQKIIHDHAGIYEYVENYEKIMQFKYSNEAWEDINPVYDFFQHALLAHFQYEENHIFPILTSKLATSATIAMVEEFQQAHKELYGLFDQFKQQMENSQKPPSEKDKIQMSKTGLEILDKLQKHSAREDDLMVPIIKKHREMFADIP